MLEDAPDYEKFAEHTRLLVKQKAQLLVCKDELDLYIAELCRRKPRDATVKLIGIDDESKARLMELRSAVRAAEQSVEETEAEISIMKFERDVYKTKSFNNRA